MSLVEIRKLRKKIRQIECLEQVDRELTADEVLKVLRFNRNHVHVPSMCHFELKMNENVL